MRKAVIWLGILILLLSVWNREKEPGSASGQVRIQPGDMGCVTASQVQLQRELVRWYNLNLRSDSPDNGFQEAYSSILQFPEGNMGYVEFIGLDQTLPLYHDGAQNGLVHSANTPFPIGEPGSHTVLVCREPIRLQSGEKIVISILDLQLTYQVGKSGSDMCTIICGNASYHCGRVEDNRDFS